MEYWKDADFNSYAEVIKCDTTLLNPSNKKRKVYQALFNSKTETLQCYSSNMYCLFAYDTDNGLNIASNPYKKSNLSDRIL